MKATVIADASFCSQSKSGGWACWIAYDGGVKGKHSGLFRSNPADSSEAELNAVLNGLRLAYQNGARNILVQTDCLAIVHAVNGQNKFAAKYREAKIAHFPLACIRAKHVKGHTRTEDARSWCNRWCDTEAKKHMRRQRDGQN
jgi:ribonuclease HI